MGQGVEPPMVYKHHACNRVPACAVPILTAAFHRYPALRPDRALYLSVG
jgi:hypothetical protein